MAASVSLSAWYGTQRQHTPLTRAFLHGSNLLVIQRMLTEAVRAESGLRVPEQPFTEQMLSELQEVAFQHREAEASAQVIANLNDWFVNRMVDGLVADANEDNAYGRYLVEGFPDPNNMTLPIIPESSRKAESIQPDDYMLSHPLGMLLPEY